MYVQHQLPHHVTMQPPPTTHNITSTWHIFFNANVTLSWPQQGLETHCVLSPRYVFFFFLDMFFFFYYTNEYQWFKFSWTYVWTWQRQQGRGKGSRCVTTCLICLFSFYVLFTILTSIWISYAYKWTQQGRGKGLRPHLIMWRGWCYDFKWL